MTVCKFFQQGICRNGDNCRFEHPAPQNSGYANQNRFAPLGNRGGSGDVVRKDTSWNISTVDVRNDLTEGKGRPKWILTTYGPGRNAPASLLEGNEYSPEEIRLRFYEQASKGNQDQADQEAIQLWTNCNQSMKDINNNVDNVIKYMEMSETKRPNRYDFCKIDGTRPAEQAVQVSQSNVAPRSNPGSEFGAGTGFGQSSTSNNRFAKPTAASGFGSTGFGQTAQAAGFGGSAAFGKPALGATGFVQSPSFGQTQPITPATPAFGQQGQSSFGQPTQSSGFGTSGFTQGAAKNPFAAPTAASAFGGAPANSAFQAPQAASGFGQLQGKSVFGQATTPNSTFGQDQGSSAFGQAGAFGKPAFGQATRPTGTVFGQPTQPTTTAFGQPTQPTATGFGQPTQAAAASFGQPAQAATTGFGQPTQAAAASFGQPAQAATKGFGQPTQSTTSSFGQSIQSTTASLGQPTQSTTSGFGQPATTTFGTTSSTRLNASAKTPTNPFGQPADAAPSNPFGVKADSGPGDFKQPALKASPFGQPSQISSAPSAVPNSTTETPVPTQTAPNSNATATRATNAEPGEPHPLTQKPAHPLHYTQTLSNAPSKFDTSKRLTTYRGRRVQYINGNPCYERPDRKGWERVWFPQGAAGADVLALNVGEKINEIQGRLEDYTDSITDEFRHLFLEGKFRDGKMPLVPPMREWCLYDF